jgi:beta-lactamase regulating signal transducer with metallopeptidase domain
MAQLIENLNAWSGPWLSLTWAIVWQSTLLAGVAAGIAVLLRRAAPGLRYWLWQIVAIKLLLMPFWIVWVPLPAPLQTLGTPVAVNREVPPPSDRGGEALPSPATPLPMDVAPTSSDIQPPVRPSWFAQITWRSWLLLAWLAIVVCQVLRIFYQRLQLARLLRLAQPANDERLNLFMGEISRQLALRRVPAAVSTDCDCSPFVFGLWRPIVVLPRGLLTALNEAQLRQVLLHELAHVKRRDLLWGWLPEIARLVYWFHPVAHWIHDRIRLERELACDQLAIALSGQGPAGYADTLVRVVSHASRPALFQTAAASSAGFDGGAKTGDES